MVLATMKKRAERLAVQLLSPTTLAPHPPPHPIPPPTCPHKNPTLNHPPTCSRHDLGHLPSVCGQIGEFRPDSNWNRKHNVVCNNNLNAFLGDNGILLSSIQCSGGMSFNTGWPGTAEYCWPWIAEYCWPWTVSNGRWCGWAGTAEYRRTLFSVLAVWLSTLADPGQQTISELYPMVWWCALPGTAECR